MGIHNTMRPQSTVDRKIKSDDTIYLTYDTDVIPKWRLHTLPIQMTKKLCGVSTAQNSLVGPNISVE